MKFKYLIILPILCFGALPPEGPGRPEKRKEPEPEIGAIATESAQKKVVVEGKQTLLSAIKKIIDRSASIKDATNDIKYFLQYERNYHELLQDKDFNAYIIDALINKFNLNLADAVKLWNTAGSKQYQLEAGQAYGKLPRDIHAQIALQILQQEPNMKIALKKIKAYLLTNKASAGLLNDWRFARDLIEAIIKRYQLPMQEEEWQWTTAGQQKVMANVKEKQFIKLINLINTKGALQYAKLLFEDEKVRESAKLDLDFLKKAAEGYFDRVFVKIDLMLMQNGDWDDEDVQAYHDLSIPFAKYFLANYKDILYIDEIYDYIWRRIFAKYYGIDRIFYTGSVDDNEISVIEDSITNIDALLAYLSAGGNANWQNGNGDSLLLLLIKVFKKEHFDLQGLVQIIKLLLSYGIDLNLKNNEGQTALDLLGDVILSVKKTQDKEIEALRKIFLNEQALAAQLSEYVRKGNIIMIDQCLRMGLPVNWQNANGDTLLHLLLTRIPKDDGRLILEYLIVAGIDFNLKNRQGKSALDLARALLVGVPNPFDEATLVNLALDETYAVDLLICAKIAPLLK